MKEESKRRSAALYESAEEIIGMTPMLHLARYEKKNGLCASLYAKLEAFNPTGSAKDRAALSMIDAACAEGKITDGTVIIEPTSGNTGIGLASVCTARGLRCVIVMPDSMSKERIALMKAYGAEVVLTPGALGMSGAIAKAEELKKNFPSAFIPDQFGNPANADAHYRTTGPEIFEQLEGKIDVFVAAVGTGGTLTGIARYLKEKDPTVLVVAVEPAASPLLSGGKAGPHGIQGIGANFIPAVLDRSVYDKVMTATEEESFAEAASLGKTEGILCGISGGAALAVCRRIAADPAYAGKRIATVLPDSADRYFSSPIFEA